MVTIPDEVLPVSHSSYVAGVAPVLLLRQGTLPRSVKCALAILVCWDQQDV